MNTVINPCIRPSFVSKRRLIWAWGVVIATFFGLTFSAVRADDMTVSGSLYVGPPTYYDSYPQLQIHASADPSTVQFGTYYTATWIWGYDYDYPTITAQMVLDPDRNLTLFSNGLGNLTMDPGNQTIHFNDNLGFQEANSTFNMYGNYSNITFDPDNQAIIFSDGLTITDPVGALTVNGTIHPTNGITLDPDNQTIAFTSGLTINGASSNLTWTIFAGDSGFSVGNGASAGGSRSAAFGGDASTSASFSVALANGTVDSAGTSAFAVGDSSHANATNAVAMGGGSATGNNSLAFGPDSTATGNGSLALGIGTNSTAWSSMVVGHYNANITANSTSAFASIDPAFIVGIGQNGTTGKSNGLVVLNNGIIYAGTGNGTTDSGTGLIQGSGTRLMWIPQKYSFFAGTPYSPANSTWNYSNIGNGTIAIGDMAYTEGTSGMVPDGIVAMGYLASAFGRGTVAIGLGAAVNLNDSTIYYTLKQGGVALGASAIVHGTGGVAIGGGAWASYDGAVALGYNATAGGNAYNNYLGDSTGAVAMGYNSGTIGPGAVAIGNQDFYSNGTGAVAIGNNNIAAGSGTVVIGNTNSGTAVSAIAIGSNNTVTGTGSAALGSNLTVSADHALVAGQWALNVNSTSNITFAIGNGNATTQSNAFTILKNGNTTISGNEAVNGNLSVNGKLTGNVILQTSQGDIPMGAYGD